MIECVITDMRTKTTITQGNITQTAGLSSVTGRKLVVFMLETGYKVSLYLTPLELGDLADTLLAYRNQE